MVMHFTYDVGAHVEAGRAGRKKLLCDPLYYNHVLVFEEFWTGRHVYVGNAAEIWQKWLDTVGHGFDGEGKQIAETEKDFMVLAVGPSTGFDGALSSIEWAQRKAQSRQSPIKDKAHFNFWKKHEISCRAKWFGISLLDYLLRFGTVDETSLFGEYLANFEFEGFDRKDYRETDFYKERYGNGESENVEETTKRLGYHTRENGSETWGPFGFDGGQNGTGQTQNNRQSECPY